MELKLSIPVNGRISSMVFLKDGMLWILMEGKEYAILKYEEVQVVTLQSSSVLRQSSSSSFEEGGTLVTVHHIPSIGVLLHLYRNQVCLLPYYYNHHKKDLCCCEEASQRQPSSDNTGPSEVQSLQWFSVNAVFCCSTFSDSQLFLLRGWKKRISVLIAWVEKKNQHGLIVAAMIQDAQKFDGGAIVTGDGHRFFKGGWRVCPKNFHGLLMTRHLSRNISVIFTLSKSEK